VDFHIIGIVTSNSVIKELMCNAISTVTYLANGCGKTNIPVKNLLQHAKHAGSSGNACHLNSGSA
jgi:hypothetical protein